MECLAGKQASTDPGAQSHPTVTSTKMPPRMMDTERSKVRWASLILADRAATFISDWYPESSFLFSSRRISERIWLMRFVKGMQDGSKNMNKRM